jgi:hypothetical protein
MTIMKAEVPRNLIIDDEDQKPPGLIVIGMIMPEKEGRRIKIQDFN